MVTVSTAVGDLRPVMIDPCPYHKDKLHDSTIDEL
jgi:hypothetical protein